MMHLQNIQLVAALPVERLRTETTAIRHRSTNFLVCLLLACTVGILNGCAAGIDAKSDRSEADARISAQVKVALVRAPGLAAAPIDVVSRDGNVRLSGFVETEMQRERAHEIAAMVAGVKAVENRIEVK